MGESYRTPRQSVCRAKEAGRPFSASHHPPRCGALDTCIFFIGRSLHPLVSMKLIGASFSRVFWRTYPIDRFHSVDRSIFGLLDSLMHSFRQCSESRVCAAPRSIYQSIGAWTIPFRQPQGGRRSRTLQGINFDRGRRRSMFRPPAMRSRRTHHTTPSYLDRGRESD